MLSCLVLIFIASIGTLVGGLRGVICGCLVVGLGWLSGVSLGGSTVMVIVLGFGGIFFLRFLLALGCLRSLTPILSLL